MSTSLMFRCTRDSANHHTRFLRRPIRSIPQW